MSVHSQARGSSTLFQDTGGGKACLSMPISLHVGALSMLWCLMGEGITSTSASDPHVLSILDPQCRHNGPPNNSLGNKHALMFQYLFTKWLMV